VSELKVLGIYAASIERSPDTLRLVITTAENGQQVFLLTRQQASEIIGELSEELKEMGGPLKDADRDRGEDESDDRD
jgi:hypothetical protein